MMEEVAQHAAKLWGFAPDQIRLTARRENIVWHAENASGAYALRLHRPGYRSNAELKSELQWMDALVRGGLSVPRPLPSRSGALVEQVGDTLVDLLTWLPGQPIGAQGQLEVADRTGLCRKLGLLLAQMHAISDAWTPPAGFSRPAWDRAGLLGDAPVWGPFWDNPGLTPDQRATLLAARDRANTHLAQIEASLDTGLIHADALSENILIHDGALSLIDFDDGGWGFRDFELATFLMRFLPAPDYSDLRAALLEGYASRRPVDPATLDLFILLRALTYPGWIIPRIHEPGGAERSARAIATALPLAEAYLTAP
ncbi:MAG: phosphotransferase enzyme family protein [Rhodobacterales bacterium]